MHSGYHYDYHYKQGDPFRLEKVDVKSFATETEKADTIRMVNLYEFDGNGNQTMEVANPINDSTCLTDTAGSKVRQYLWDEDNHLLAINDNGFVSNYFYDAAGERTVKISAPDLAVFVNGAEALKNDSALVKFVGYVSPYLVVSNGGRYTKHIYAGTQRIASKVGDIEAFGADPRREEYAGANLKEVDFGSKYEQQTKALMARYDSLGVMNKPRELNDYVGGQSFCCGEKELVSNNQTGDNTFETPDYEHLIFFYHPDHLGSTSLVTDNSGNVVQSVAYIPYGEVFIEERNGTWNTPYLFNAKELDEETGLYYYGARYLNPTSGMWLSVDPLFEKYVGMSPYQYCYNNPIILIDPDGRGSYYSSDTGELLYMDDKDDSKVFVVEIKKGKDGNIVTYNEYIGQNDDFKDLTDVFNETLKNTAEFFEKALDGYEKGQKKNNSPGKKLGGYVAKLKYFKDMVTDGAKYDIKNNEQSPFYSKGKNFPEKQKYAYYNGKLFRYDDFGNFNYGVAGKAFGFSDWFLEAGAGINQLTKPDSPHDGPYFDDKRDNYMIKQGIIFYNLLKK